MKTYIQTGQPFSTIGGKQAPAVIKSSKQYQKYFTPFIYNDIIIDSGTLQKGKVYFDTITGQLYLIGSKLVFPLMEQVPVIDLSNINPVMAADIAPFVNS